MGVVCAQGFAATSPSTAVAPYLESHLSGVGITSILTVGDGSIPDSDGGTTRLVGIPDGIGAIDGSDAYQRARLFLPASQP